MGGGVCSLLTFLYLYVLTRMIKLSGIAEKFTLRVACCGVGACVLSLVILSAIPALYLYARHGQLNLSAGVWIVFLGYQMPPVVMMALVMLIMFEKFIRLPKVVSRVVEVIAPSMFGVYLGHTSCVSYGRRLFQFPQEWLQSNTSISPYMAILISAVICFTICIGVDLIRRFVFARINRSVADKLKYFDDRLGLPL